MPSDHPFQNLFETLNRVPAVHAAEVNRQAHAELADWLSAPLAGCGGFTLLRAPRAGHGKTHILSLIRHQFAGTHECVQLRASRGYQIDAATVTEDVTRHLLDPTPESGRVTGMDHFARHLLALGLQSLVESGEVPSQDPEEALLALREKPVETFDFHDPAAVTAQWTRENFAVLGGRLSTVLGRKCGLPVREVAFWVDALFDFASSPLDGAGRQRSLEDAVRVRDAGGAQGMDRLEALLGLLALTKRVVLIADDLEGFSADPGAALRLATLVVAIRQSVPRLEVLISLNRDVWEHVFVPCLSEGLADRLAERVVELKPLTEPEMIALLESRVPGQGARVLSRIDRAKSGTHARGLIREAAAAWIAAPATGVAAPSIPAPPIAVTAQPPDPAPLAESALPDEAHEPPGDGTGHPVPTSSSTPPPVPDDWDEPMLDPEAQARVEELLRQFRERFGQDRS